MHGHEHYTKCSQSTVTHYMVVNCMVWALQHCKHAQIPLSHENEGKCCLSYYDIYHQLSTVWNETRKKEKCGGRIGWGEASSEDWSYSSCFMLCISKNHVIIGYIFAAPNNSLGTTCQIICSRNFNFSNLHLNFALTLPHKELNDELDSRICCARGHMTAVLWLAAVVRTVCKKIKCAWKYWHLIHTTRVYSK